MTTPRIEEILEEFESRFSKDGLLHDVNGALESREVTDWLRTALTEAYQAGIDEALERIADKIESKRHVDVGTYSKESTLLSTGYNHCIDDVHKIINGNNQEDE